MKEKSIFKNYIFNTIYNILNILFPIITVSYVSRILMAEGIGKVSFATSIVSYFIVLAQLGIPKYGPREIAKKMDKIEERNQLFWEIYIVEVITTIFVSILYLVMISTVKYCKENYILMLVVGIQLIFNLFFIDWFYTGMEEYEYITTRSIFIKIISIIAIFLFVKRKEDYINYALIQSCAVVGNYIFNIYNLRKYLSIPKFRKLKLKRHIKPILILFFMAIAIELYSQLDTIMLGTFSSETVVGYYSNPMKMVKMLTIVIVSLSTVLLPRLSWYYENGEDGKINELVNLALKVVLFLSLPACIGIIIVAKPLILVLFGSDFFESIQTIKILSFLIPILSVGNLFGTQILMVVNQEKKLLLSVVAGAIVNVILNSIFIAKYKQNGAAFASVIAEMCVMIIQIIYSIKFVKININKKDCFKIIIGLIALSGVAFFSVLNISDIFMLGIQITSGVVVFIFIEYILKNSTLIYLINYLKSKVFRKNVEDK